MASLEQTETTIFHTVISNYWKASDKQDFLGSLSAIKQSFMKYVRYYLVNKKYCAYLMIILRWSAHNSVFNFHLIRLPRPIINVQHLRTVASIVFSYLILNYHYKYLFDWTTSTAFERLHGCLFSYQNVHPPCVIYTLLNQSCQQGNSIADGL